MPGGVCYVSATPNCQICQHEDGRPDVPAVYDGATQLGPWAFMCERHKTSHGIPGVGTGIAQKLVERDLAEGNKN